MNRMGKSMRRVAALFMLGLGMVPVPPAYSQEIDPIGAVTLVAAPRLIDPDYRGAVLLAVPVENNRHVGVIINRPTGRSLASLFPEHVPSKLVHDPVYFGGPMLRQAIFAVVHIDHTPGPGSIQMMKELFLATQGAVVDHIIEQTPNEARYYVGYVAWRPGELSQEVDRGLWYVLDADPELVFRKDPGRLWEELLPGERFKSFTEPIFFGGPVALQGLFAVFRADRLPGEAVTMLPGLYLALQPDTIDALLNNPPRSIRFFAGYSGWAPGQLRGEIDRGDWLVVEADADTVKLV